MSIVLEWTDQARTATFDSGRWSATQNYIVRDTTNQAISVTDIAGDPYLAAYQIFGNSNETISELFRFTSYSISPADGGGNKIWNVNMTFNSSSGDGNTPVTTDVMTELEVGFTCIEVSIQPVMTDQWILNPDLPVSDALKNNPDLTNLMDGGGTIVYAGKDPVTYVGSVMNISIRNVKWGRPDYELIASYIGTRNDDIFTIGQSGNPNENLACVKGGLLFTGASSSRTGPNQYEINYQFVYDPIFYHLRQQPLTGPEGVTTVPKTPGDPPGASNPWRASVVYYKQPFHSVSDFESLGLITS
jgi:hypothetical protein